MNTNFVWHLDKANHIFYVPSDQVKAIKDKSLQHDFDKRVTKDGREIYFLKNNPLPEYISPTFEKVEDVDLKILQKDVAQVNQEENKKLGLMKLPGHLMRDKVTEKLDQSSKISFAHTSKKLREMLNDTPDKIKANREIANLAAREGNFEILKWALENNAPFYERTCLKFAAQSGNEDVIFLLIEKILNTNDQKLIGSGLIPHYKLKNGVIPENMKRKLVLDEIMAEPFEIVAKCGYTQLFKNLLNKYGKDIHVFGFCKSIQRAIDNGDLEIVKSICALDGVESFKNQGNWHASNFYNDVYAARCGQVKILDWFHKNGINISKKSIKENSSDSADMIAWAISNNVLNNDDIQEIINNYRLAHQPRTLEFLRKSGYLP